MPFLKNDRGLSLPVILLSGLICSCMLLGAVLAIRYVHQRHSPSLKSSERLLDKGKYRDALTILEKMEKNEHNSIRELSLRGRIMYSLLQELLRKEQWGSYGVDPENWISHPLALEAERCFLGVLAVNPNDAQMRLALGNLYKEQGRFSEAEQQFSIISTIDDRNVEVMLALGVLYAETDQLDDAGIYLAKAWELDRKNPRTAKNIAFLYRFYKELPESSMVWFNRYLNLDPKRDLDANLARIELGNLIERYPEFTLQEPQNWREQGRRFVPKR